MIRSQLKVITLKGTPLDVAYQLGKMTAAKIPQRIEFWNRDLARLYSGRKIFLKDLEKKFLHEAQKQAPQYVDEIRAMSAGAQVPFEDLFRLNLTELNTPFEKCTTVVFPIQTTQGRKILIGHNEDWNPLRNDVFVLKVQLPDMSYVVLTYDGYLTGLSCGFNSHGLYHTVNYLRPRDMRVGLPRAFITHYLTTATSMRSTLKWIGAQKRAFGQSIHLATKDQYVNLELTAHHLTVRRPSLPTAHANHYLSGKYEPFHADLFSSTNRQKTAEELIQAQKKPGKKWTRQTAKKTASAILSDRSGLPCAIWREADNPHDNSATVASALFDSGSRVFEVYRKSPKSNRPLKITLTS